MSMDPTRRIAKWNSKFDTARIKGTLDAMREKMYQNVQNVFPAITAMESQVKQVLDMKNVPTCTYPSYLGYGRELWSLIRREFSGPSLAREAAVLLSKWKDRGFSQAVLESIRSDVFSVGPPTP
jgi:hypothetical protein